MTRTLAPFAVAGIGLLVASIIALFGPFRWRPSSLAAAGGLAGSLSLVLGANLIGGLLIASMIVLGGKRGLGWRLTLGAAAAGFGLSTAINSPLPSLHDVGLAFLSDYFVTFEALALLLLCVAIGMPSAPEGSNE